MTEENPRNYVVKKEIDSNIDPEDAREFLELIVDEAIDYSIDREELSESWEDTPDGEIGYSIDREELSESWEGLVDEEIGDMDIGYLDAEHVDNAGYGDLLEALGYVDRAIEGREVDVEIDGYTTDQLKWGSLEGPVVLNLEMDATHVLDVIDDSRLTYEGEFVEVDHDPQIVLGFGTYEGGSDHKTIFATDSLRVSAPDKDFYDNVE